MLIQYGFKRQRALGLGFVLLLESPFSPVVVGATIVGNWCDQFTIEASGPITIIAGSHRIESEALGTQTLFAGHNRTELEAGDSY